MWIWNSCLQLRTRPALWHFWAAKVTLWTLWSPTWEPSYPAALPQSLCVVHNSEAQASNTPCTKVIVCQTQPEWPERNGDTLKCQTCTQRLGFDAQRIKVNMCLGIKSERTVNSFILSVLWYWNFLLETVSDFTYKENVYTDVSWSLKYQEYKTITFTLSATSESSKHFLSAF